MEESSAPAVLLVEMSLLDSVIRAVYMNGKAD